MGATKPGTGSAAGDDLQCLAGGARRGGEVDSRHTHPMVPMVQSTA